MAHANATKNVSVGQIATVNLIVIVALNINLKHVANITRNLMLEPVLATVVLNVVVDLTAVVGHSANASKRNLNIMQTLKKIN